MLLDGQDIRSLTQRVSVSLGLRDGVFVVFFLLSVQS